MIRVTLDTLDGFIAKYAAARGGELNEDTDSEAMFVCSGRFSGVYVLSTAFGPMWIGVQNATARSSSDGEGAPFATVRDAVKDMLTKPGRRGSAEVFYSDDAAERLRWMADRIASFKAMGGFLLCG